MNSVRRLDIHKWDAMDRFASRFPNVNELSFNIDFDLFYGLIVNSLHHRMHLRQLIQINLRCYILPFNELLELLHATPHVRTLELHAKFIFSMDLTVLQKHRLFHLISDGNMVTKLIFGGKITLKELQLLIKLLPRLEFFAFDCCEDDLEPIISLLLSKVDHNIRRLSCVCILTQAEILLKKLRNLIESQHLLQYYHLKQIDQKLYLWW